MKIGTYPTALLSPATAGLKAGLAALIEGGAESSSALPADELRKKLGYDDYDQQAKRLAQMFRENFEAKFADTGLAHAGPSA